MIDIERYGYNSVMLKIISGGQTGVDRAALDAALERGMEIGGWCPQDRKAEDGVIPQRYQLVELANAGYMERTRQNVIDSDGTAIIYFAFPSGGTEQTIGFCIKERKPYVLIDAEELTLVRAAEKVKAFIVRFNISTLNVAGPRASGEARAYPYAKEVILGAISKLTI